MVVLDHYNQSNIVSGAIGRFVPALGRESVIVFFILSGYVIAYTTAVKQQLLKEYIVARSARIYSVALPVLLIAFVLNYLVSTYSPGLAAPSYQISKAYLYIPFHILFLGELWNLSEVPPWLVPYWSLGYEVWYYVFFAAIYYFSSYKRIVIGAIVFLILGHKLWLLLPIWMSGVLLFHWQSKFPLSVKLARAGCAISMFALCVYKYFGWDQTLHALGISIWPFKSLVLGSASRFLADYFVGVIVLINFYCARYAQFSLLEKFSKAIRSISSFTFTLYLVHMLVISMWLRFYLHDATSLKDIAGISLLIALVTYVVGSFTEHKKQWFAVIFDRLLTSAEKLFLPAKQSQGQK